MALEVSTIRGRWVPAMVPSSGMDTWKSDSTSSSASVSTSTRSTSSISSTTVGLDGLQQGRVSRNGSEKMSASTSAQLVVGPVGLDAQELLLVVPLVQGLALVQPLVALEPDEAGPGGGGQGLGQLGLADPGRPSASTGFSSRSARKATLAIIGVAR